MSRLCAAVAGAPNYRQIGEWPVFGVGQPTFDGMQSVLENLQEAKLDNVRTLCCWRLYVC